MSISPPEPSTPQAQPIQGAMEMLLEKGLVSFRLGFCRACVQSVGKDVVLPCCVPGGQLLNDLAVLAAGPGTASLWPS